MSVAAKKRAVYEDLCGLPENVVGGIIDDEVLTAPRPSRVHAAAASRMNGEIIPAYDFGRGGGPGGWVILMEPETALGENIVVPDRAGWKKERVTSAGATQLDFRGSPLDLRSAFFRHGRSRPGRQDAPLCPPRRETLVAFRPDLRTLEVFVLENDRWVVAGAFAQSAKVRAEPFMDLELDLSVLWLS
ncbi:hypothetical protein [Desulfosoma caldarium]|uniref:Uncharacterized protein n=1 Tax=Desulfosoma caldarium TaxID=610254 RepID=A0A3N1VFW4_9BACT|nr:hypothetical protein [Desulfosoma caldarium]ROR01765.1 hypothetical protein EDC27_0951 [Desulfosoma caldarium]